MTRLNLTNYDKHILSDCESYIRFEIGVPDFWEVKEKYMESVYIRSALIFEEIFKPNDDITLIIEAPRLIEYIDEKTAPYIYNKIKKYIKNDELRNAFELVKGPDSYLRDDEMTVYRCILKCKTKDIKYRDLLKALGNQDMCLKPSFSDYVIFVHNEKEIAYNLYDDRGLDLNSWNRESLRGIYTKFNKWILDYNRKEIDNMFKK